MVLYNFIKDNYENDDLFDTCDVYPNYMCMLCMNIGQFINDHVLINYVKKISHTTLLQ
jgi:hypothetical protein